jgi:hypothetical protein
MQRKAETLRLKFLIQFRHPTRELLVNAEGEVGQPHFKQGLIREVSPVVTKGKTPHAPAS